jgi:deoxyribose-phosphate aldolase
MNQQDLVTLITQQVKAQLTSGGSGAGYTRAQSNPYTPPSLVTHSAEELREIPCDEDPDQCSECGLCAVRRPEDTQVILKKGADRIGAGPGIGRVKEGLAGYIDHTLLKPDATRSELATLAEEARKHIFATVCVNSVNVRLMTQLLGSSPVPVCAVVGFPLGAMTPRAKAYETKEAIRCGAQEIDMVVNIGALKSRDHGLVFQDIKAVVDAARPIGVKVILETSKLTHDEKVSVCALSVAAGASFVKTSTGFGGGGATIEDVTLMRDLVGPHLGVKASGGVRDAKTAQAMIDAGANRIGASASVAIVMGKKGSGAY